VTGSKEYLVLARNDWCSRNTQVLNHECQRILGF